MGRFLDSIPVAALQAWLVFCIIADVATLTLGVFLEDGDLTKLTRSDNPYIVGFACGTIAATGAALFVVVDRLARRPLIAHGACLAALAVWCGNLMYATYMFGGRGYDFLIGPAIGAAPAIVGWPLFPMRFRWPVAIAVSLLGLMLIAAWHVATSNMKMAN